MVVYRDAKRARSRDNLFGQVDFGHVDIRF